MQLRAPNSRRRPNRLLEELEDSDGFNPRARAYSPGESSNPNTRSSSQPVQLMDRRLRPAFPPPTKPFNPNLPPAAFPSLPLVGPGSNPSAASQQQGGHASKNVQRQDSAAPQKRRVVVLRYRKRLEEDTMDPDEMSLYQLVIRDTNILNYVRKTGPTGLSRSPAEVGFDPNPTELTFDPIAIQQNKALECNQPLNNPDASLQILFEDLHQLMRATMIVNVLSESIEMMHGHDIFWSLRMVLMTTREVIYRDLNYVVDIVLEDKYPNILGSLQPQMRHAEAFLKQRRQPIRFLYSFKLGTIMKILQTSNAQFTVLPHRPIRCAGTFVAPCPEGWEPLPPEEFPLGVIRDAPVEDLRDAVVKNSTYNTIADYSQTPVDRLPSPFLRKRYPPKEPVDDTHKTLEKIASRDVAADMVTGSMNTDSMDVDAAKEGNATAASTNQNDDSNAMDICEAGAETGATDEMERNSMNPVNRETVAVDPADDLTFMFDETLDIFVDMPSPILRGVELSTQPGAAPMSSWKDREFSGYNEVDNYVYGIFYEEEQTEFYPGVRTSQSATDTQQGPAATNNSSQANTAKAPEIITAPIDFTEVFLVTDQAAMYKRNWVLNHLLGLGEEIREATLKNKPEQRGGEDVSIGIERSDPVIESCTPQRCPDPALLLDRSTPEQVELPNTATPMRERQASDGYFPRSFRSLPPRSALPRRSLSLQELENLKASILPAEPQTSPATILAAPDSSPGILLPCPPPRPLQHGTVARSGRGRPRKKATVAKTPKRVQIQEPPDSAATIPMIDSSPGIILPRNYQPQPRSQNRRGEHKGSPVRLGTKQKQSSVMCSSSSTTSSYTESETPEPPVLKSRSFLHERGSGPPLGSFRPRSNVPEATPTTNTTLVVSNKGRNLGYASVLTRRTSHPRPNNRNSMGLNLDAASLRSSNATLPISSPAFSNIRLPDRAVFDQAPRSAPLPSSSSWNAPHGGDARGHRSSYSPMAPSFAANSSNVNSMHPIIQHHAANASGPPYSMNPVHDSTSRSRAPGQNKTGAKIVNVDGRHRGGGRHISIGEHMNMLREQAMERNRPDSRQESGEEEHGGHKDAVDDGKRSPSIRSVSTISTAGSSGDEEFERQKRIDEEAKERQRKLFAEEIEGQQPLVARAPPSSASPPSQDVGMEIHGKQDAGANRHDSPHDSDQSVGKEISKGLQQNQTPVQHTSLPFPPWSANPHPAAAAPTAATPSPNRPRSRSRISINAAGQFEVNSPFTHSALSPHRPPRPPGDENTPGIRAPPRKRKWSMLSHDGGEEDGRD
ncbi:hypothetical protein HDK90DRAFT_544544 [Phyllosticta capitalensis]|uniref:Uncharacterized protein n=1 Tax=Phyllosticta capitalensis TaxID=121624 RepID=A0ABR1YBB9_9PEZI